MKLKIIILTLLVLISACGKQTGLDSPSNKQVVSDKQTCVSNFISREEVKLIEKEVSALPPNVVGRSSLLTQLVHLRIGLKNTSFLFQSGLLTDWLVLINQNQSALKNADLCRSKKSETL